MKKIYIVIIILLILLVPIRMKEDKQIEYRSLTYRIKLEKKVIPTSNIDEYKDGVLVEILGLQIYSNMDKKIIPGVNDKDIIAIIYMNSDVTKDQIKYLESFLNSNPDISSVVYKSKEEAKEEIGEGNSIMDIILSDSDDSPLLDTFSIKITSHNNANNIIKNIEEMKFVKTVIYNK